MNEQNLIQSENEKPRINSAKIFGVRAGNPFLYLITASGKKPITFGADNLPSGLSVDANTGLITGKIEKEGIYEITLYAKNERGTSKVNLKVKVGEEFVLTPPMGWNHWNCWGPKIDEEKVRDAADSMVSSGLKDHGWLYVNIDDGWQGKRDPKTGALQANEKFSDMKALCDYIHGLGLKVGIYSTPWRKSYANYAGGSADSPDGTINEDGDGHSVGKYRFEMQDAKQWAEWGIDYLKYDWNPNDVESTKRMYEALRKSGRDIALSLSNTAPYDKILELSKYAQCWRTTGDIVDSWTSPEPKWAHSVKDIGFSQSKWVPFCTNGHWNDMDMLVVGKLGWGTPRPTRLTHDELYTHITQWCIMSSPLLLGCDMKSLDEFTLSLLTNDEVLAVSQDPSGKAGRIVKRYDGLEIWAKDLYDGTKAVGLYNLNDTDKEISFDKTDFGFIKDFKVRDLWKHAEEGTFDNDYKIQVKPHGVHFINISEI